MAPLVLVDVSNLAYRSHYAFPHLQYDGKRTGTYHGFLLSVSRLLQGVSRNLVFCWDNGVPHRNAPYVPCWRKQLFVQYKSGRGKSHEEDRATVKRQMPVLRTVLSWMGFRHLGAPGLEADDIIALVCAKWKHTPIIIYSSDRDLYQCLRPHVSILPPSQKLQRNKPVACLTAAMVEKEFGFPLTHWAAYLAMGGDSSDSIKPARGMGPQTAKKLILEGADPTKPFKDQPAGVKKRFAKLLPHWKQVTAMYHLAALPTSLNDARIAQFCSKRAQLIPQLPIRKTVEAGAKEKFLRFCADRALVEVLSVKREFFRLSK